MGFLIRGYWGCAAGWGRIFTARLTSFNRVTRMGLYIFESVYGVRQFFIFTVSKRTIIFVL